MPENRDQGIWLNGTVQPKSLPCLFTGVGHSNTGGGSGGGVVVVDLDSDGSEGGAVPVD